MAVSMRSVRGNQSALDTLDARNARLRQVRRLQQSMLSGESADDTSQIPVVSARRLRVGSPAGSEIECGATGLGMRVLRSHVQAGHREKQRRLEFSVLRLPVVIVTAVAVIVVVMVVVLGLGGYFAPSASSPAISPSRASGHSSGRASESSSGHLLGSLSESSTTAKDASPVPKPVIPAAPRNFAGVSMESTLQNKGTTSHPQPFVKPSPVISERRDGLSERSSRQSAPQSEVPQSEIPQSEVPLSEIPQWGIPPPVLEGRL
jgi:hypothetical protein